MEQKSRDIHDQQVEKAYKCSQCCLNIERSPTESHIWWKLLHGYVWKQELMSTGSCFIISWWKKSPTFQLQGRTTCCHGNGYAGHLHGISNLQDVCSCNKMWLDSKQCFDYI